MKRYLVWLPIVIGIVITVLVAVIGFVQIRRGNTALACVMFFCSGLDCGNLVHLIISTARLIELEKRIKNREKMD